MQAIKTFLKKQLSLQKILFLVFVIASIRVIIELILLDYSDYILILGTFQNYTRFYLENLYYFIILFLLLVVITSKITKQSLSKVSSFGIKMFPVILLPPLIDHFFFGRTAGYLYAKIGNFLYNFLTISWLKGDASFGISFEITLAVIFIAAYVFYITRSFWLSLLSVVSTLFVTTVISTPDLFFGESKGDFVFNHFLPFYYFFPLIILASLLYSGHNKEKFKSIISNLRPVRAAIFVGAVLLGFFATIHFSFGILILLPYFFKLFLGVLSIMFVWWFSIVLNDIHDSEIDKISNPKRPLARELLTKKEYKFIAVIFAFFALSFAAVLSWQTLLFVAIGLALAFFYSVPPIRLKKYPVLGNLLIGFALVIAFSVGSLSIGDFYFLATPKNLIFSILLLLFGTIITLTKDLKDIEADSKFGIKNIYTLLGRQKGKKLVTILFFVVLNTPAFLIKDLSILPVTLISSSLASYLYYKKGNERLAYVISALLIIYVFINFYYV